MTRARMLRVMPHAEFVYWSEVFALRGEVDEIRSQHPKWSGAEIWEWVRHREEMKEQTKEAEGKK